MKIRLFLFLLLSIAIKAKDSITLISRDKVKFNIALEAALLSNTIKNNLDYDKLRNNINYNKLKNNKNNIDYNKLKNNIDYDKSVLEDGLELDMFSAEELEIAVESLKQIAELYKERGKDTKKVLEYDYHDRENLIKENMASITELISNVIFGRLNVEYQNESIQEIIRLAILLNIGDFLQIYELIEGAGYILSKKLIQPEVLELFYSKNKELMHILNSSYKIYISKFLPVFLEFLTIYHNDILDSGAISPNSRYVATASHDNTSEVWDIKEQQRLFTIHHNDCVNSVTFSFNNKYVATGSDDNTVQIWDINKKELIETINYDNYWKERSIVFSPDSEYIAVVSSNNTVKIKCLKQEEIKTMPLFTIKHAGRINTVAFSPNSKYVATASLDNTAQLWNLEEKEISLTINHTAQVESVVFSHDGRYLATSSNDCKVKIVDMRTKRIVLTIKHDGLLMKIAFSPKDRYVATVSYGSTSQVWDIENKQGLFDKNYSRFIDSIVFSSDEKYLAISSIMNNSVQIWDVKDKKILFNFKQDSRAKFLTFSPDNRYLATCSYTGTLDVVDIKKREVLFSPSYYYRIKSLVFSPDINLLVFTPDSRYLAISLGDYNRIQVWDVERRKQIFFATHDRFIKSIAFSPDSKFLATFSYDNTAKLWKINMDLEQVLFLKLLDYLKEQGRLLDFNWNDYLKTIFFRFNDESKKAIINRFDLRDIETKMS